MEEKNNSYWSRQKSRVDWGIKKIRRPAEYACTFLMYYIR